MPELNNNSDDSVSAIADMYELAARHRLPTADVSTWLTAERRKLPADTLTAQFRSFILARIEGTGKPLVDTGLGLGAEHDNPRSDYRDNPNVPYAQRWKSPAIHTRAPREYNLLRACSALAGHRVDAGFEFEISQELERREERQTAGLLVPPAVFSRAVVTSADVPAILPTDYMAGELIDALRPHAAVLGLHPTILNGLTKNAELPRLDKGTSAEWIGENAAPSESMPEASIVPLNMHQLAAHANITRKVMMQADPRADALLRSDMLKEIAVTVDKAAIAGSGVGNEPRGILNTVGVGSVAFGTNGGAVSWSKVLEFLEAVESENITGNTMAYLSTFRVKKALLTTERAAGTAKYILDDANEKLAGCPIAFSGNVPYNLTKGTGTNLSAMLFGNWSDLIIGCFGAVDVIVDPYTESHKGNTRITAHSGWDFALKHVESFAVAKDIATS